MNKQELLDLINKTWPLGIDTQKGHPILRFQNEDKQIKGYSLNICNGLKLDYNNKELRQIFAYEQITDKTLYEIINSTLYLHLAKCLLEINSNYYENKKRLIAVGHTNEGKPIIFCNEDSLDNEENIKKYIDIYKEFYCYYKYDPDLIINDYRIGIPFPIRFLNYYYFNLRKDYGIPLLETDGFIFWRFNGFLDLLPISINDWFDSKVRNNSNDSNSDIKSFYELLDVIEYGEFSYSYLYNDFNLIYTDVFTPNYENIDFTLDYLLLDDKIIFLNDFNINEYYNKYIELIKKLRYYPAIENYINKFNKCYNDISDLLNNRNNIRIDEVLDLSEIKSLIDKYRYWIIKESCNNFSEKKEIIDNRIISSDDYIAKETNDSCNIKKEIFPKGLICSTDNIDKESFLKTIEIDGNIELNICGINKIKKVPYENIKPIKNDSIKIDINNNKLLWSDRDRILYKESGIFDYFVNTNDELISREYYVDYFSKFLNVFINHYLNKNYLALKDDIKQILQDIEITKMRINNENYTKIVNNLNPEKEIDELVENVCIFARHWNLKFDVYRYYVKEDFLPSSYFYYYEQNKNKDNPDKITEKIIKYLSLSKVIRDDDMVKLKNCFNIFYFNSYVNEKDKIKSLNIKNLMKAFFSEKQDDYKKREIIFKFRRFVIGLSNYEEKLYSNISKIIKDIASITFYSLIDDDKGKLFKRIKKYMNDILENILQYPHIKNETNLLNDLEKCDTFSFLASFKEKITLLFPEILRKRWKDCLGELLLLDKINLDGFNKETATFLINIDYELDNSKEYTKEELEPIWKRCNFQMEDYSNEEYSFEATLNNLLKAGFLKNKGDNYVINE